MSEPARGATPLADELQQSKRLARLAGAEILAHYGRDLADNALQYKDAHETDPVTQADKDANELIVRGLAERFPGDAILAEESANDDRRLTAHRLWCIDPLDGTREFVERNGQFVVMIGLAIEGRAVLGVVYQPTEDTLWYGVVGQGAFEERRDGTVVPLRVSANPSPKDAVMMVSRSHRSKTVSGVAENLGIGKELPLGSVGLKVARVAAGVADVYISVSNKTQEWDACGPEAILRAAGGEMTDCRGQPLLYNKKSHETPYGMLASNGTLHPVCVAGLRPVVEKNGWL